MTDAPGPLDYSRAMRLLLFTAPNAIDLAGVNATLDDIAADGRVTQAMLALCDIAHTTDPMLRTERGKTALRAVVAKLQLGDAAE